MGCKSPSFRDVMDRLLFCGTIVYQTGVPLGIAKLLLGQTNFFQKTGYLLSVASVRTMDRFFLRRAHSIDQIFGLLGGLQISPIQIAKELAKAVNVLVTQIGGMAMPIFRVVVGEYGL